ncbi:hypothetical protein HK100_011416 [Physocladia obscura]|uniref:Telomerase activating protein Est1-like N-terminal domain-containing protein n=1 Tax=Physocladia obscura TaxID=109957 RepID=A0AAD5XIB6_9FUNG|nr:hypothetical protein HK100_011416 [Physocladia obscura]
MDRENQAELLVGDYKLAIERGVETVLWKHHYSRIGTFRSEITAAKKDRNAPALTVAQAAFREFLDDAIFFYVRLVIRLAEAHSLKRVIRIFVMHQALRSFVVC